MKVLQKGFNFSQDGPGNRLVYHLQGCNLHCPWCSNPESMAVSGSLLVKGEPKEELCPLGAIHTGVVDRSLCKTCPDMPCVKIPGSPLKSSCTSVKIEELLNEVKRSSMLFFEGGGVTFTGGEPTMQFEALKEVLIQLKTMNINTCIETNGSNPLLPELFEFIDFLIIDFKHYDNDTLKKVTGLGNETVLKNITSALSIRPQLLVRIPLIGGFNASVNDAEGFAKFFDGLDTGHCSFELLRYHEYGKDKWAQCGLEYTMRNAQVSDDDFKSFSNVFKTHNLHIIRT